MTRLEAWKLAQELIDPIVDKHGLELITSGSVFAPNLKTSASEQHVNLITEVAEWLMKENEEET